jgi:hypothetical protein
VPGRGLELSLSDRKSLGDGDGEREGADGGDEEDGEGTRSPNLSIKRSYLNCNKNM